MALLPKELPKSNSTHVLDLMGHPAASFCYALTHVQRSAKGGAPGLVNLVLALGYHIYLSLPAAFTQPGARLLAEP